MLQQLKISTALCPGSQDMTAASEPRQIVDQRTYQPWSLMATNGLHAEFCHQQASTYVRLAGYVRALDASD